ncbi:MAG TPA: sugar transferase [Ktedonobacteraceae bacterium]|jgi:exopolysaccharide biosynthesis polyprenyl glycosylphosphotransferase|nr:sugar transferase [Ktedonobacteraceae bacterium]
MARIVKSSELSEITQANTEQTGVSAMTEGGSGATGAITKVISRRRSHRHQWRIFEIICMLVLDTALIDAAYHTANTLRTFLQTSEYFLYYRTQIFGNTSTNGTFNESIALELSILFGALLLFAMRGLYRLRLTGSWFRQSWIIISTSTMGLAVLITYYFIFLPPSSSRVIFPLTWAVAILMLCIGRLIVSITMGLLYRLGLGETRLLVVGSGHLGKMVMQHIAANPNLGYSIVGFLHDMNEPPSDFGRFKMLGTLDDLGMAIRSMQVDEVIIALPSYMHQHAIKSVKLCERLGASFKLIPDLYEMNLSRIDMEAIEGIPLIGIKQISLNTVQRLITRMVDIAISSLALLIGSPIWLCIALAVRLNSAGPIIYKQTRIGINGKPFGIMKFRSMYKDADQRLAQLMAQNEAQGPLFKMKDDPRATPVGKFLRRTSLDEIPQFINVLKGDMSLVGPRPPLLSEVAQYEEWQKARLAIKPGLSGLSQVRGRSNLSFDEIVLMDLYYIENWSLRLYFQILLRTVPAVLFNRGAY